MNFLLKYPTRGRREIFESQFQKWNETASGKHTLKWVISCDRDDPTMEDLRPTENRLVYFNPPAGKIAACNANVNTALQEFSETNVLVLVSDDMIPQEDGWDDIIASQMTEHYPDYSGAIHINDGVQGLRLCTLSVMGIKLYREFGYFYHPDYVSTHCDNEYTEIIWRARRAVWYPKTIIKHEWVGMTIKDDLHNRNHALMSRDQRVFDARLKAGFPRASVVSPSS